MTITEEQFDNLRPVKNPHGDHGFDGALFETFGAELNFVRNQPENRVWTLVDDDEGNPTIVSGFHLVNRIGYFVTEEPWTEECTVALD